MFPVQTSQEGNTMSRFPHIDYLIKSLDQPGFPIIRPDTTKTVLKEAIDGLNKTKCNIEDFECKGCVAHNSLLRIEKELSSSQELTK